MTLHDMITTHWQVFPVNRGDQRKEFRSALERIRVLGSVFQTIYEWYGSPGIGKSTLLQLLKDECQDANVSYAFVNFSVERNPRAKAYQGNGEGEVDATLLIEDLFGAFENNEVGALKRVIAEYRSTPKDEKEYENRQLKQNEVARTFVRFVGDLTRLDPVVLLFDETERADQDMVGWLEEWIINPLIQNGRCLIVWAGRKPQRWKRFEVRRRVRLQELDVFNKDGTEQLFEKNSRYPLAGLSAPVRKLTRGHPFADTIVLRYLDAMARTGKTLREDEFGRIETELLDGLVQKFIDEFAFRDLSEQIASACRVMSLVRQFDVIMLREILTKTVHGFDQYERSEFGNILSSLRSTQLVIWDDRRKGYSIDATLRQILSEYISRHNPDLFTEVNQVAIQVYQGWIKQAGDNRGVYIVEELYQQAWLNHIFEKSSFDKGIGLYQLLEQRIHEYPQQDPDSRASALDRLYHELEDDRDILRLIAQSGLDMLLKLVRQERIRAYDTSQNDTL